MVSAHSPERLFVFLPPRKSIDSAKKLRLISSAGKPGERPAIAERPFGMRAKSSPFWEGPPAGSGYFESSDTDLNQGFLTRLGGDAGRSSLTGRMECSDHYRAIPLSDGYHILFTDPSTGLLCLGSDAPVGGPTKLLRKIWFLGPRGESTPIAYSAGADLSCGVRIVLHSAMELSRLSGYSLFQLRYLQPTREVSRHSVPHPT